MHFHSHITKNVFEAYKKMLTTYQMLQVQQYLDNKVVKIGLILTSAMGIFRSAVASYWATEVF